MISIKYIGIVLTLVGIVLLALVIIRGRKSNIAGVKDELDLITGSGYATTHKETRQTRTILESTPVKVPPRKRALSREAADILKKVEKEREAEKISGSEAKGTAVLEQDGIIRKGTDILPAGNSRKKGGTDILPSDRSGRKKGTDVLPQNRKPGRGTDVLPESGERKRGGTAVLPEKPSKQRTGTDILPQNTERNKRNGTAVLEQPRKGTDVLPERPGRKSRDTDVLPRPSSSKSKGTDILPQEPRRKKREGTAVLEQPIQKKQGTAVLEQRPKKGGTDILPEKKGE